MYITQTQLAKMRTNLGAIQNDTIIIQNLLKSDAINQNKIDMRKGDKYYHSQHDILDHDFRTFKVNGIEYTDYDKSNNKIPHPFLKILVDQKVNYLVGKPPSLIADDATAELLQRYLNDDFFDMLNDWANGASTKGAECLHLYINTNGEFDYTIIPAEEIIPIYDRAFNSEIVELIRYYTIKEVNDKGEERDLTRVEWWDAEKVTFYIETHEGNYVLDDTEEFNPRPHFVVFNTSEPNARYNGSWGRVPFIMLYNNSAKQSDLTPIKALIDDYDFNTSEMSNNLSDIQEAIWVLMGYDGTDLAEFRKNLRIYKAMKVTEEGGATPKTLDIPIDARDSHLDRLVKDIYIFGQGVNMDNTNLGNSPSGIALRFMYALLVLKAAQMERKLLKALKSFVWFIGKYEDVEFSNDITFKFNYTMISNDTEVITNLVNSQGLLSNETLIEQHPYVADPKKEIERKAAEAPEISFA